MSIFEIWLLAISLSFDTFAVSIAGGACISKIDIWRRARILLFFALFQAGFTFIGWALGSTVSHYIEKYDHWVAFILLAYIGGKMIYDSFQTNSGEECVDLLNTKKLIIVSIATSIDALAVGISLSMLQISKPRMIYALLIIAFVTALFAEIGLRGGKRLGKYLGQKSNLIGGIILIAIGTEILIEHLFV